MNLKSILRSTALILALIIPSTGQLDAKNVLLFTIDSCRADRFGVYGYEKENTPNIDRWAKTGVVFGNAYSTASWTAPGVVSVLSGLYPPTHGVNNRDHMGSPDLQTLLKIFGKKDYRVPNLNFFTFAPYYKNLGLGEIEREYFGSEEGIELINWLKKNADSTQEDPFFLWYHTTIVHQPYNPSPEDLPAPREKLLESPGIKAAMTGAIVPLGSTTYAPEDGPLLNALYDAEVRQMDRLFGQAIEILQDKDLLEDTLIVLTADHGEELLDHGFIGHASTSLQAKLYEEFIRIPLILSWPGRIDPESERVNTAVIQTDIFPTVLSLFDIEVPEYITGRNLLGDLEERPLFFESVIAGNQTTKEREHLWVRAVRDKRYKYISTGELYDLQADPREQKNIINEKPQKAEELRHMLNQWLEEMARLNRDIFTSESQVFSADDAGECPKVYTPQNGETLNYDVHTGAVLFDWSGDKETSYLIEYDIGTGDHHVAGTYEVKGNHQLLGPFSRELWGNLKAWNPFKFRVSRKRAGDCWSQWVGFEF
ncbi:MAG: sulfatase family protein [Acidobacteriota bacterium]